MKDFPEQIVKEFVREIEHLAEPLDWLDPRRANVPSCLTRLVAPALPRADKPRPAYKIRNIRTNQYWRDGRWTPKGRVWTRMSDVKNVLNHMTQDNFIQCEIVDYVLVPSTTPMISLDSFNKVLEQFKEALGKESEIFSKNY